jgi:SAM-dependent methyltransferase
VLTVDYDVLDVRAGDCVLDVGCGEGRHTFEALRRGAEVVSVDIDAGALRKTAWAAGSLGPASGRLAVRADARALPFPDAAFDRVICAETLEHIDDDATAIDELARVLRPGGRLALTVPRYLPERVCWALSREYRETPGGHVRIYRGSELRAAGEGAGLRCVAVHHAHALHTPYWWLRCLLGPPERARLPRLWQRMLVWEIEHGPTPLGRLERALDPVLGKSVVLYFEKPLPALVSRPRARLEAVTA